MHLSKAQLHFRSEHIRRCSTLRIASIVSSKKSPPNAQSPPRARPVQFKQTDTSEAQGDLSREVHIKATTPQTVEDAVEIHAPNSTITWTARWWPVLPTECLDPKLPTKVDLVGKSLVVWSDSQGQWHCMEDRCPHRLAPLSEGRVEGDTIMCSYHGWCFNSSGACTRIPQLEQSPEMQAKACSNPRSRAKTLPTRLARGLLWIWPEAGTAASQVAATTAEQPMSSGADGQSGWFVRDLPLRYDTLLENLLDPSHAPFSHHGVLGNRYKLTEMDTTWNALKCGELTAEGFTARAPAPPPMGEATLSFAAPMLVSGAAGLQFVCVPTKPGWSRLIANSITSIPGTPPIVGQMLKISAKMPWLSHALGRNAVFDGDTALLHAGERQLPVSKGLGSRTTGQAFYIPAPADAGVVAMRRWIQDYAGDIPTCTPADEALIPVSLSKKEILDRWEQHTKHCKPCQAALAVTERGLVLCQVLGVLAASAAMGHLAAAATLSNGVSLALLDGPTAASVAAVTLSVGVHRALAGLRNKYIFEDYVHATKD